MIINMTSFEFPFSSELLEKKEVEESFRVIINHWTDSKKLYLRMKFHYRA